MSFEQLLAGRRVDIQEMRLKLAKTAEAFGLPFRGSDKIYNSRFAQELGLWSASKNIGDEFHAAVFKAYFVNSEDIAKIPVLVKLASSVGLPGDEAAVVLATRAFKEAVDADWALSRAKSITAVPTFVMNQDRLVGAQPYEALEGLMEAHGVKRRVFPGR
jgi:predicted DsbA family dithiol-disulfide isomerase